MCVTNIIIYIYAYTSWKPCYRLGLLSLVLSGLVCVCVICALIWIILFIKIVVVFLGSFFDCIFVWAKPHDWTMRYYRRWSWQAYLAEAWRYVCRKSAWLHCTCGPGVEKREQHVQQCVSFLVVHCILFESTSVCHTHAGAESVKKILHEYVASWSTVTFQEEKECNIIVCMQTTVLHSQDYSHEVNFYERITYWLKTLMLCEPAFMEAMRAAPCVFMWGNVYCSQAVVAWW